jgi:uncharacterized membrane protein
VLFVMISNHYALTYGHQYNWAILIAMSLAGALIRVYFVNRHFGKASPMPAAVAALLLLGIAFSIAPKPVSSAAQSGDMAGEASLFAQVSHVMQQRCVSCHASAPTHPGFVAAPKGVVFNSEGDIVAQAQTIHQQVVVTKAMPIGNLTGITDAERGLIDNWYRSGAKAK